MKLLIVLLAICYGANLYANETIVRGEISLLGIIKVEEAATVRLKDVELDHTTNNHPCGKYNNLTIQLDTEAGRAMYSQLLAAYMAGRSVRIDYSNYSCGLWGNQPIATRVYFGA